MDHLLALTTGLLVVLSMSMNSALGKEIGVFRATAVNYTAGLLGSGLLALVWGWSPWSEGTLVPWWAWSGGFLGVIVVAASNLVLPRIPVVTATILLILGQLGTGLVIDALATGTLNGWQLAGAALVLAGATLTGLPQRAKRSSPHAGSAATLPQAGQRSVPRRAEQAVGRRRSRSWLRREG